MMGDTSMNGRCIMVVEDEYLLADDVREALASAGAEVCGPFANVETASAALDQGTRIDGALLDVNLAGEMVFDLADALVGRGIPFTFTTGYDRAALPERYLSVPRIEKPIKASSIVNVLGPLMRPID